jgi:hypothetical protein
MDDTEITDEEKVIEMWTAWKKDGAAGVKRVCEKRNAEWRRELEQNREQGTAGNSSEIPESGTQGLETRPLVRPLRKG